MRRVVSGLKCVAHVPSSIPEYFALFGLEPRFSIDAAGLTNAYREVLSRVHPDRHAGAGASERRAAMQLASHANEAYRILKSDVARAAYLCRCHGAPLEGPNAAPPEASFLERQMRWHEALETARKAGDANAIVALSEEVEQQHSNLLGRIAQFIDVNHDFTGAAQAVRALMFLEKIHAEIDRALADRDETAAAQK
ncbi:MAG TPA: Fe-S protein assembly co-chaperone HscB [Burkholderiaceae bacterium]|nr:Fe-S protein assembly co-chaperone HscB [Burkholderiaceae bacterium]